jgi:hypothetical protein
LQVHAPPKWLDVQAFRGAFVVFFGRLLTETELTFLHGHAVELGMQHEPTGKGGKRVFHGVSLRR